MVLHGYGKILNIDLTTGEIEKREINPEFARKYIGGYARGNFGIRVQGVVILGLAGLMITFHAQHDDAVSSLTSWLRSIV